MGHLWLVLTQFRKYKQVFSIDLFFYSTAPEAILEADGGTLTDIFGNHYQYGSDVVLQNKLGVIATAKTIDHNSIINKIPDDVKAKLKQ